MGKVLVVDDETAVRELLYDTFSRKGFEVLTATSGQHALEILRAQRPVMILLDCSMPELSGLETAKKIRDFDDAIPIILLRGPADAEANPEDLKRLKITHVLHKGVGIELFYKNLDLALKQMQQGANGGAGAETKVPGTLLVIDDEPSIQKLVKAFFETRGLRILLAGCGEDGLAVLDKEKPTLVMLDINMPGMDGVMTLRKIRAKRPDLPVIIASSFGEQSLVREALEAGAYDYVTKPFNLEYLETVVFTKVLLGMEG